MGTQLATSLRLSTSINFLEECGTCEDMDDVLAELEASETWLSPDQSPTFARYRHS